MTTNMTNISDKLKALHAEWCRITGQNPADLKYQAVERYLWDFFNNGFVQDDLRCVLVFIIHQNSKRKPEFRQRLNIHNLLSDMGRLASFLGEARAHERNRIRVTEKQKALAGFRSISPDVEPEGKPRHISEIFKNIK